MKPLAGSAADRVSPAVFQPLSPAPPPVLRHWWHPFIPERRPGHGPWIAGPSWLAGVLLAGLILGLAGCGSPAPVEPDRYFSLAPPRGEVLAQSPLQASLVVNDLAARGFLGGRQILFRTEVAPLEAQRYERLLWDEPLPRALARHLVDAIASAGLFAFVLTPADRGRADFILNGEVERFEHWPTATPPRVTGALSLTLTRAADRLTLLHRRYQEEIPVEGATPEAMVAAASRLADLLADQVVRDLNGWMRHPSQRSRNLD